jgi:hypothetical protein
MIRTAPLAALLALTLAPFPAGADPVANPYAAIDRHALKAPKEAEGSVKALAEYLAKPAKNDKEKARAVYRWVTDRIAYDTAAAAAGERPDPAPENVLKTRKAICGGYALLFKALCEEAGVKAVVVSGKAKGHGYVAGDASTAEGHGWNAIKLGEDWHLVDATWGAGGITDKKFVKHFHDFFFLPPPEALIFTHFPKKADSQLLTDPISEKEFDRSPKVPSHFFEVGVTPAAVRKALEAENFPGLVKLYDTPASSLVLKEVPLAKALKAGQKYKFRVEATEFPAVVVSSGARSFPLTRKGKVFEGSIVAPRGTIKVQGVNGEGNKIIVYELLEYEGE